MKVVAVLGSANENGNSSTLAKELLRGAAAAGHETVVYEVNKMNLSGCQGCGFCRRNGTNCRIQDDMTAYWKDLQECGALILSSPNYYSQVTGPMITFMNRHYCLSTADGTCRLHAGIKLFGIFAQGNTNKEAYMPQYNWYLSVFQGRGMVLADTLVCAGEQKLTAGSPLMQRAFADGKAL
ncbi:MAG: flavodoxin family protein [Oscillospiraceae bacterium]|jgi:multimeric flavodoxin WrbA|nr:flavodoxin family protein [Oscillospiraceae bacterium]MDD3260889.1 flavodoxin family protein [Oscillospiraceae bacterium]